MDSKGRKRSVDKRRTGPQAWLLIFSVRGLELDEGKL